MYSVLYLILAHILFYRFFNRINFSFIFSTTGYLGAKPWQTKILRSLQISWQRRDLLVSTGLLCQSWLNIPILPAI